MRSDTGERRGLCGIPSRATVLAASSLLLALPALASEDNIDIFPLKSLPPWGPLDVYGLQLLLALIAIFVVLVFWLNGLLFKPIFAALDVREEKIAGTRRRAEKLAAEADEVLARYEARISEVRQEAEEARRESLARARSQVLSEAASARGQAEGEIEDARREIGAELARARAGLRASAEQLAREAAARVLGRQLS